MFPKSESKLFANSTELYEEVNIFKSCAYRQGTVDFKPLGDQDQGDQGDHLYQLKTTEVQILTLAEPHILFCHFSKDNH